MTDTTTAASEPCQAVGAPVEQPVRLDPERAAFNAWMDSPVAPGEAPEPWISDLAAEAAWQAWKHRGAEVAQLRAALAATAQADDFAASIAQVRASSARLGEVIAEWDRKFGEKQPKA